MEQKFSQSAAALIANDIDGRTRSIVYPDGPARYDARDARAIGNAHLRAEARRYGLGDDALKNLDQEPATDMTADGAEIRLRRVKQIMDTVVLDYCQTLFGLPVWRAGVAVVVKDRPQGVLGSTNTALADLKAKRPSQNAMRTMRDLKPDALAKLIGFKELVRKLKKGKFLPPRINNVKPWIYRYDPAARQDEGHTPKPGDNAAIAVGVAAAPCADHARRCAAPAAAPGARLHQGRAGLCRLRGAVHSLDRALGQPQLARADRARGNDGAVCARTGRQRRRTGFHQRSGDDVGQRGKRPGIDRCTLDPLRQSVTLLGLNAPSGGNSRSCGNFVPLQDVYTPTIASPIQATGADFDFGSRTNDFAAANAYFHSDYCFRLVDGMGLNSPTSYFDGTTFPLPIDHRGSSTRTLSGAAPATTTATRSMPSRWATRWAMAAAGSTFSLRAPPIRPIRWASPPTSASCCTSSGIPSTTIT